MLSHIYMQTHRTIPIYCVCIYIHTHTHTHTHIMQQHITSYDIIHQHFNLAKYSQILSSEVLMSPIRSPRICDYGR